MCKEIPDHEIQADAEQEWLEQQRTEALEAGPPEPFDPTDEELEDMNRVWQEALRGCVEN